MTVAIRAIMPDRAVQSAGDDPACRPYLPPRLDPREVAVAARLFRRRRPSSGDVRGEPLVLEAVLPAPGGPEEPGARFAIDLGRKRAVIDLPWPIVDRLAGRIDPLLPPAREVDPACLALLLECALESCLECVESRLAGSLVLRPATAAEGRMATPSVRLRATLAGDRFEATLAGDPSLLSDLADLLDTVPTNPLDLEGLPVDTRFRAGSTTITAGMLARLKPGDGILPDDGPIPGGRCLVVFGDRLGAVATIEDGVARLEASPGPLPSTRASTDASTHGENTAMSDFETDGVTERHDTALDDLEVQLVFELGRRQVPLGDLRSMAAGHVFELGREMGGPVDILANGQRVGCGELVEIGHTVGVRIARMFDHG